MYSELLLLFGIIIGVYEWGSSYKKLSFENNYKVRGNYLSFTHSVVSNIVSGLYLYNQNIYLLKFLLFFSSSYFIWDLIFLATNNKISSYYLFIYHHLMTILILFMGYYTKFTTEYITLFHIGELSNFFNYPIYHMIKKQYSVSTVNILRIVQFIWFFYYRVYKLLFLGIQYSFVFDSKTFIILLWIIYLLGVVWGVKQFLKLKSIYDNYMNLGFNNKLR